MMGVTPQKPGTDALPVQPSMPAFSQAPYLPAQRFPPPGPQPLLPGSQFTNGSSGIGNVPMFAAPPQMSTSGIGGPPLPTAPGTTYLDSSSLPAAISTGQSAAVGPPPKSGFVRK